MSSSHAGDRWTLAGRGVRAVRAGRRDPDSQFDASWRGNEAGLLDLRASASYLRADTLLPLAGLLPQKDFRERLREIAPTGEWIDTCRRADARLGASQPWQLQVKAQIPRRRLRTDGPCAGIARLERNDRRQRERRPGRIDTRTARVQLAGAVSPAGPLDTLKATLYWKRTAEELLIATPDWEMKNRDASVHGKVAWTAPADGTSPLLDAGGCHGKRQRRRMRAIICRERSCRPPALAWLDRAFVAGHLSHADVVLRGPDAGNFRSATAAECFWPAARSKA